MADDRPTRPSFRDRERRSDGFGARPGAPQRSFGPRPGGFGPGSPAGPPRPPLAPRPAADTVSVRLRDGDREVEVHGSLTACRQLLDDLPALWARLRPASGVSRPSISLPAAPAPSRDSAARDHDADAPGEEAAPAGGAPTPAANGRGPLEKEVLGVLRTAGRPIGIAEIRSRLSEDVSGQAVRRVLERSDGVVNVGGRPAAYRLR